MSTANAITNLYQNFLILNLCKLVHHVEGRGPFMVTQDGCDPNDYKMRQCSFVLTKRGTWLHFYLYLALPEAVRRNCVHFDTIQEVLERAGSLPSSVTVEDASSLQELIREAGFELDANDSTGQALLQEVMKRHDPHRVNGTTPTE